MNKVYNNSHYYTEYSRTYNLVLSSHCFRFESAKRMGYFQRIYYEFLYTQKIGGQTFFYTLTYNNKSIPKVYGENVFSYDDIRYVTNGRLSKILKRQFGSRLRYFCACETGEGKGSRGVGCNPHYHFIFFVQPEHDSVGNPIFSDYKPIVPLMFRNLIRELWMGTSDYVRFEDAKFGIAKEGLNLGVVTSPAAFRYVGKYCLKDVYFLKLESQVEYISRSDVMRKGITYEVMYSYYLWLRNQRCFYSKEEFFRDFDLHYYRKYRRFRCDRPLSTRLDFFYKHHPDKEIVMHYNLLLDFFNTYYVGNYVANSVADFRNRFGSKPRMSKSLGEYGLQFVDWSSGHPRFKIPFKDKIEVQSPALFYIRKLFYDVYKCPITGNPLYRLNDKGIDYKVSHVSDTIDRYSYDLSVKLFSYLASDFQESISSDTIKALMNSKDYKYILRCYTVYKNYYEFRYFKPGGFYDIQINDKLQIEAIQSDLREFLKYSVHWLDYTEEKIYLLFPKDKYLIPFSSHPVFQPYIDLFKLLDDVVDLVDGISSDVKRADFLAKSEHQKRVASIAMTSRYLFS